MKTILERSVLVVVGLLLGVGWFVASGAAGHGTGDEGGRAAAPAVQHGGVGAEARALPTDPTSGRPIAALSHDRATASGQRTAAPFNVSEEAELLASDGAAGYRFGLSVAIEDDTALVGAPTGGGPLTFNGSAYVYVRNGTTWAEQAKLVPGDRAALFGSHVALSGDTAVVGAEGTEGTPLSSGAAYVFVRDRTTWTQQAKLVAADAAKGDMFAGDGVALDGDTAVIGATGLYAAGRASGCAYVFVRTGTTWTQEAKLTASDAAEGDLMGFAVAVDSQRAIVGAPGAYRGFPANGAAYVFVRNGTSWTEEAAFAATSGASFGVGVDIGGSLATVGNHMDTVSGKPTGSAYVFARDGAPWIEQARLAASDGENWSYFGRDVALDGDTVAVGAFGHGGTGRGPGSAYVFERRGAAWTEEAKLLPGDGAGMDGFGYSVGLDGRTVLVGAPFHNHLGSVGFESGSAYVYRLAPSAPSRSVALDVDPDTLNLNSRGRWITAYLTMEGASASDINPESLSLNGALAPAWWDAQGDEVLMVKFDRAAVESMVAPGERVAMWVTGQWRDGELFEARDTIRVIG